MVAFNDVCFYCYQKMSQLESIDLGFTPDLRKRGLSEERQRLLAHWCMPFIGKPAPAPEGKKAAVWHGSYSKNNEAPVIAVVANIRVPIIDMSALWFYGLASRAMVEASDEPVEAYQLAATYGAIDQYKAIDHLALFAPLVDFTEVKTQV